MFMAGVAVSWTKRAKWIGSPLYSLLSLMFKVLHAWCTYQAQDAYLKVLWREFWAKTEWALYNSFIIKKHCCIINKLDKNQLLREKSISNISKRSLSCLVRVFFLFNVQPQRFGSSWSRSCAVVWEALKWASVSGGLPRDEEGGQENPPWRFQ